MKLWIDHTEHYEIEISKKKLIKLFSSIGIKEIDIETMTGIEEYDYETLKGDIHHRKWKVNLMCYFDDIYEELISTATIISLPSIETECKVVEYEKDFHDDEEKMKDFWKLSKKEFLLSYSYLTEEEYDLTVEYFKKKLEEK